MNVTIVGSGNGGTALAANLSIKGHHVTLLKTSKKLHNDHFKYLLNNNGKISYKELNKRYETKIDKVTTSFKDAFSNDPKVIVLFIQTNYHEEVIKRMSPYLKDDQLVIIEPGYLSTAYFLKHCKKPNLIIAEAESSPLDCRITSPGKVDVIFKNVRNPIGIYPNIRTKEAMDILKQLDLNFTALDSVVEAALHNPNLIVHTIGAIMSIPRIEYTNGNYWMYKEVFTPSIWNLVKILDNEKMQVLQELNLKPMSYVDACKFRNSKDLTLDAKKVFMDYAQNNSISGPHVSNSRYITEDVPEGLVLLESLGTMLNIETPVCSSLINIASSCLKMKFRKSGRNIKKLGKQNVAKILGINATENKFGFSNQVEMPQTI